MDLSRKLYPSHVSSASFFAIGHDADAVAATYTPVLESLNGVLAHLDVILR